MLDFLKAIFLFAVSNFKGFALLYLFLILFNQHGNSQEPVNLKNGEVQIISDKIDFYIDSANSLNVKDVISNKELFIHVNKSILNFYETKNLTYWFRFVIVNHSGLTDHLIEIDYTLINQLSFYEVKNGKVVNEMKDGLDSKFYARKYGFQNPLFDSKLVNGDTAVYFLKVKTAAPVFLPVKVGSKDQIIKELVLKDIITGVYIGIILSLFLYNIFIYFTVKDSSYIYYVLYIFFMGLTQITLFGYAWRFFLPNSPEYNSYVIIILPSVAGIASIGFGKRFLNSKIHYPLIHKLFNVFTVIYFIAVALVISNNFYYSFRLIDLNVALLAIYAFILSIAIARKGNRYAVFFLISWTTLLVSVVIYSLRNIGIFPYNNFTSYSLYFGSAVQTILLSIALADRINIYKKEKEVSQAQALEASLKNEVLVREQNIVLEQKVNERTEELQDANYQLNGALTNLKDAQTQLVDAEKMASLGQLTAGIAHEINNPINFVKSNIKPLQLDFRDLEELLTEYNKLHGSDEKSIKAQLVNIANLQKQIDLPFVKTEIVSLIKGIEEGAERTAEIVRGLRTFSRLDEGELKTVSIHEGIDSTLVLLKNSLPYNVSIVKDFKADGNIDCYPGKLNQVFMNIINNGIQAIQAKPAMSEKETVTITTKDTGNGRIIISIKDSGIGMSDEVKQKIFEPFFTTKPVGEGTGLGMAIAFKIIETHKGKIDIISSPGNGSEFILSLPHTLSETSQNPK